MPRMRLMSCRNKIPHSIAERRCFWNCFSQLELKKNLCPSRVQKRRTTSGVKSLFNDQKKMQTALPSSSSSVSSSSSSSCPVGWFLSSLFMVVRASRTRWPSRARKNKGRGPSVCCSCCRPSTRRRSGFFFSIEMHNQRNTRPKKMNEVLRYWTEEDRQNN